MRGGESIGWAMAFECVPAAIFGGARPLPALADCFLRPCCTSRRSLPAAGAVAGRRAPGSLCGRFGSRGSSGSCQAGRVRTQFASRAPKLPGLRSRADVSDRSSELAARSTAELRIEDATVLEDVLAPDGFAESVDCSTRTRTTAGELQARIERHHRRRHPGHCSDATQELHDALADAPPFAPLVPIPRLSALRC